MLVKLSIKVIFIVCLSGLCIVPTNGLDKPELKSLLKTLDSYEKAFHGLSYSPGPEFDPSSRQLFATKRMSRSEDGEIREWEGRHEYQRETGTHVLLFAGKASANLGWSFRVSRKVSDSEKSTPAMTMTLFEPASGAVASGTPEGFIEHLTFAEYANQCTATIEQANLEGKKYWLLNCDHPIGSSVKFFFDDEHVLRWIQEDRKAGDQFQLGGKYLKPRLLDAGQWVSSLTGPIEYQSVFGRNLPISLPSKVTSSEGGKERRTVSIFTDYAILDHKLDLRLEFSNFELPARENSLDDNRITSQGEEGIRYELQDGAIVKIADSDAVAAAKTARMWSRSSGWYRWYSIMGIVLLVSTGLLVWYRNRKP